MIVRVSVVLRRTVMTLTGVYPLKVARTVGNAFSRQTTESTGTLLNALPTVRTAINESLWKAGLLT